MNNFIQSRLIIHSAYSNSKLFDACIQVVKRLKNPSFTQSIQLLIQRNPYFSFSLIDHLYTCQQIFEDAFQSLSHLSDSSIVYQCRRFVKQSNRFKTSQTLLINLFSCLLFDLKQLSNSQKSALVHNLCFIRLICLVYSQPLSNFLSSYSFDQQKQLIQRTKVFFNPLGTLNVCCVKQFQQCVYQDVSKQFATCDQTPAYFPNNQSQNFFGNECASRRLFGFAPLIQHPQQLLAQDVLTNPILFYAFYNLGFSLGAIKPFYKNILSKQYNLNNSPNLLFCISYNVFCKLLKTSSTSSCEKVLQKSLFQTFYNLKQQPTHLTQTQEPRSSSPQLVIGLNSLFNTPIHFLASECQLGLPTFDHRFDFLGYTVYQKTLIPIIIELKWDTLNYKHIQQLIHYTADLQLYLQICKQSCEKKRSKTSHPADNQLWYQQTNQDANAVDQGFEVKTHVFNQFETIRKQQSLLIAQPIGLLLIPHAPSLNHSEIRLLERRIKCFKQNIIILQFQLRLEY